MEIINYEVLQTKSTIQCVSSDIKNALKVGRVSIYQIDEVDEV